MKNYSTVQCVHQIETIKYLESKLDSAQKKIIIFLLLKMLSKIQFYSIQQTFYYFFDHWSKIMGPTVCTFYTLKTNDFVT